MASWTLTYCFTILSNLVFISSSLASFLSSTLQIPQEQKNKVPLLSSLLTFLPLMFYQGDENTKAIVKDGTQVFIHQTPQFPSWLKQAAAYHKLGEFTILREYLVAHVLYSLQASGKHVFLKGGCSLSLVCLLLYFFYFPFFLCMFLRPRST